MFFFGGAGSNACKPGDEINERQQKDKKLMGLEREKGRGCLVLCLRSVGSITNVNVGLRWGWGDERVWKRTQTRRSVQHFVNE